MKKISLFIVAILLCVLFSGCAGTISKSEVSPSLKGKSNMGKVTIRWRNETEQDNYGFNIYRGEDKEGSFAKINKEIIPGAGTTSTPKEYVYVDQPLEIGKIYFYYVESVSFAGAKEKITPVVKVVVKYTVDESEPKAEEKVKEKSKEK